MLQAKYTKDDMSRMALQEARTPHSPQRFCFAIQGTAPLWEVWRLTGKW